MPMLQDRPVAEDRRQRDAMGIRIQDRNSRREIINNSSPHARPATY